MTTRRQSSISWRRSRMRLPSKGRAADNSGTALGAPTKRASTCHQGYGPATYNDCAVSFERYSGLIRGERVRGHDAKMLGSLYRNNDAKTCSSAELFCLF